MHKFRIRLTDNQRLQLIETSGLDRYEHSSTDAIGLMCNVVDIKMSHCGLDIWDYDITVTTPEEELFVVLKLCCEKI